MSEKETAGRTFSRVPVAPLEAAMVKLGLNQAQIAEELGYSTSAVGEWRKSGEMPAVVGIALEALHKRKFRDRVFIVRVSDPQHMGLLKAVIENLGLDFMDV